MPPTDKPGRRDFATWWPGVMARGRTSFIVRYGLTWAALTIVIVWLMNWARGVDWYPWSGRMPGVDVILELVFFFFIAGTLFGLSMWSYWNRRYREMTGRGDSL